MVPPVKSCRTLFYCPHAGTKFSWIRENMLEVFSMVIATLPPYHKITETIILKWTYSYKTDNKSFMNSSSTWTWLSSVLLILVQNFCVAGLPSRKSLTYWLPSEATSLSLCQLSKVPVPTVNIININKAYHLNWWVLLLPWNVTMPRWVIPMYICCPSWSWQQHQYIEIRQHCHC